jgi:uncharacterized protein (DUF1330 family)
MKFKILLFTFLFLSAPYLVSQEVTFPALQGYKIITDYPVYTPDNLWDFIDGAAEIYLSYNFENLHVGEYKKGKNVIKLEIYRHKDNIQAFGIYSAERSPTFSFINIGAQGYQTDGSLNFFKGKFYVKMRTYSKSEKILQSLKALALKVADMLQGESSMPKALTEFPDMGKKKNEETYIRESVLGHEFLQGAFRALYEVGNTIFSIFIIDKNSPDESRLVVTKYLAKAGMEMDDQTGGKYVFKDGYNGDIFLSWKDTRIVIISGLAKDQTDIADRYTSEILR